MTLILCPLPMVRSSFFSGSVMNFDVIKATIKIVDVNYRLNVGQL
jgi:hypothetical protein